MKWSILICSLGKRNHYLDRLKKILCPQVEKYANVNTIIETDNGEISIGAKRNLLLKKAQEEGSQYVSFIDDDDLIASTYVDDIMKALDQNPDCVGLEGIITVDGRNPRVFIHSLKYDSWFEKDSVYYRNPNHLNTVKLEYALKVGFPETNHGEDHDYSKRLLEHLRGKKEIYVDHPIYFYDYRSNK